MTRTRESVGFAQIANTLLNDAELSLKAKGLYSYIYSKPIGWDFAAKRIALENGDGEDSVKKGLIELEEKGWLIREKQPSGRSNYILLLAKQSPRVEKALEGKSLEGKIAPISNKYKEVININNNIAESIYSLYIKKLPKEKKKYVKSSQAKLYIEQLLKEFSKEVLEGAISKYYRDTSPTYIMAPQYFFSNSKQGKTYRPFVDYITEDKKEGVGNKVETVEDLAF